MPLAKPKKGEKKDEFISRCMSNDTMVSEYPDEKQRLAVCNTQWSESKEAKTTEKTNMMERRYLTMELRLSDDDGDNVTKIQGYAARFNKWGEGWGFREKIAPGAFKQTIKDNDDVRALFNHNPDLPLGRTGLKGDGKLILREDEKGLWMELTPTNTTIANDLKENIRTGVVSQQSFGFEVREDEWTYFDGEKEKPAERVLRNVKLYDVSPVTYPFYTDTSVALRSLDKWKVEHNITEVTDDTANTTETLEIVKNETKSSDEPIELESVTNPNNITININIEGLDAQIAQEEIERTLDSLRTVELPEDVESDEHSPSDENPIEDNTSAEGATKSHNDILKRRRQFKMTEEEYNFNNRYRTSDKITNRY